MTFRPIVVTWLAALLCLGACRREEGTPGGTASDGSAPTFSLAWSEYPSWSVFGVADELGLIDVLGEEIVLLEWADRLGRCIDSVLGFPELRTVRHFGSDTPAGDARAS